MKVSACIELVEELNVIGADAIVEESYDVVVRRQKISEYLNLDRLILVVIGTTESAFRYAFFFRFLPEEVINVFCFELKVSISER